MSSLSIKGTSVASGAIAVPFSAFLLDLSAGRTARVLVLAYAIRNSGATARRRWLRVSDTE